MSRIVATKLAVRNASTSLLVMLLACEQTTNLASSRPPDAGLDAQVEEDASTDSGFSIGSSEAGSFALCGTHPCACSNGEDDDADGQPDGFDGECTGPYDDDEATFRVNDVNEANPHCADCFYDGNARSNDDGCDVATSCSLDGTAGSGTGKCKNCEPQQSCIDSCVPITPNGCDCFGCCEVTHAGSTVAVRLVVTCTVPKIGDSIACPRCLLATACHNPCERCEVCPGKTLADLPADCSDENRCDGRTVCDSPSGCKPLEYCGQGCCAPILL
jgi:hypothetical protein